MYQIIIRLKLIFQTWLFVTEGPIYKPSSHSVYSDFKNSYCQLQIEMRMMNIDQSELDLPAVEVEGMLSVNDRSILMDDDVSSQIFGDACDEVIDVGIGNGLLLGLVGHVVGHMTDLLQPAVKESPVFFVRVVELCLLLLLIDGAEILGKRLQVVLFLIVEGMQGPCLLSNGISPLGVIDKGCPEIEEIMDLDRSQAEEDSIRLERSMDFGDGWLEVVHPVQSKQAKDYVVLCNVIELGFHIFLMELNFRKQSAFRLGEFDHIIRNVVSHYLGDLHTIFNEIFPQVQSGEAISTAKVQNGNRLFVGVVFVRDDFGEVADGVLIEKSLEMVYLGVCSVEFFFGSVELQDFIDDLVQHIKETSAQGLGLVVWLVIGGSQQFSKHVLLYEANYYIRSENFLHLTTGNSLDH